VTSLQAEAALHRLVSTTAVIMGRLRLALDAERDPARAARQAAYMRGQFAFLGIPAPRAAAILREDTAGTLYVQRHVRAAGPGFVPALRRLCTERSWWDTVDGLATHVAGPLVAAHPELVAVMDAWIDSDSLWLTRVAILHQERFGPRTDRDRLFAYCLHRAGDREFFIRKAIGWALRSYARVAPEAVAGFLAGNGHLLSGLSRREAERGVEMGLRRRAAPPVSG